MNALVIARIAELKAYLDRVFPEIPEAYRTELSRICQSVNHANICGMIKKNFPEFSIHTHITTEFWSDYIASGEVEGVIASDIPLAIILKIKQEMQTMASGISQIKSEKFLIRLIERISVFEVAGHVNSKAEDLTRTFLEIVMENILSSLRCRSVSDIMPQPVYPVGDKKSNMAAVLDCLVTLTKN